METMLLQQISHIKGYNSQPQIVFTSSHQKYQSKRCISKAALLV